MNKELLQDLNAVYNGLNEDLDEGKILLGNIIDKLEQVINYTSCCTLLLCIDSKTHWQVTKGRKYKMTEEGNTCYEVINDNGEKESYHKSRFKKVLSE